MAVTFTLSSTGILRASHIAGVTYMMFYPPGIHNNFSITEGLQQRVSKGSNTVYLTKQGNISYVECTSKVGNWVNLEWATKFLNQENKVPLKMKVTKQMHTAHCLNNKKHHIALQGNQYMLPTYNVDCKSELSDKEVFNTKLT